MKYTKEEKIAWAKQYLKDGDIDAPSECKTKSQRKHFANHVREWARMLQKCGEPYFDPHYREHSLDEKIEAVVYADKNGAVAASTKYLIPRNDIDIWRHRFHTQGIEGLQSKPKGRRPKMPKTETPKDPPKQGEADNKMVENLLARIAELETENAAFRKQHETDQGKIEFLKKLRALTEKDRKNGR